MYKCKCGETNPENFYGHKKSVCGKCHNKYTLELGQKKREFAVAYLGNKCKHCGYDMYLCSLDIHHLDPKLKDPNFGGIRSWSEKRILKEIENCILLCRNCHQAVHSGLIDGYLIK